MLPLAINLLALVIVLGMCWAAIMWLGNKSHGQRFSRDSFEGAAEGGYVNIADVDVTSPISDEACAVCAGVGAQQTRGKLAPCPECFGTGVLSAR